MSAGKGVRSYACLMKPGDGNICEHAKCCLSVPGPTSLCAYLAILFTCGTVILLTWSWGGYMKQC